MRTHHSVSVSSLPTRTLASTGVFEQPLRHVVALERRLSEEELNLVAARAAARLNISAERLGKFLDRKGIEPLTTSLDAEASLKLADTLRSAGAPVRVWTTRLLASADPSETWSDVHVGRPKAPDAGAGLRVHDTVVVRPEPQPHPPRWRRITFWGSVVALGVALIGLNVMLMN